MKYIDAEKLIAEIERRKLLLDKYTSSFETAGACKRELLWMKDFISARCQVQPDMIQWTRNNLKDVIDFTGKSPRLGEYFNSWEEYENYVHTHNDILKLFCEDGSHYEVPVGAWIVKTPDGYNVPSVAKYIQQEQPEVDLEKEIDNFLNETGAPYVWCNDDEQKEWCKIIARHFAQWQKKKSLEKTYLYGWVARNDYVLNNDYLLLFKEKPIRNGNFGWEGSLFMRLDESWFRELEWTDEPIKVKIIIVKDDDK